MKYHFKIHKENDGYWAQCLELEGCITEGSSLDELKVNMEKALNLYIEEPQDSKDLAPFPDESIKLTKTIVEVSLNPQVAFSFLVRYCRIKHGLTQKQAAKKMGFDNIYSYQRLEEKSCNPNLKTIKKLKSLYPEFSVDFAFSS